MSRIGSQEIVIPTGVDVKVQPEIFVVKGPKGELSSPNFEGLTSEINDNKILIKRSSDTKTQRANHGLVRALLNNVIIGVTKGFSKTLILQGVGYRAKVSGSKLVMNLGYSHDVEYTSPDGIKLEAPEPTKIIISGIEKQKVGQIAAEIRSFRAPEPYKGKGVRYENENVRRKAGKAGKK